MKSTALTALSYAAVLTVYAAGYERTREAADRFLVDMPAARPYQIQLPDGTSVTAARPIIGVPSVGPAPLSTGPARAIGPDTPAPAPAKIEAHMAPAPAAVPAPEPSPKSPEPESVVASAAAEPGSSAIAAPAVEPHLTAAPPETPAPAPAAPAISAPPPPVAAIAPPAPVVAPPPPPPPAPKPVVLQAGKFRGWGSCRHGDIEAEVEIARGMIVDVKITQCKVQYSCGDLYELSETIFAHQGPSADYVAGATQSTIAYYTAILNAIDKAK